MKAGGAVPKRPTLPLSGPGLEEYAATAARLVLAGRLNKFYPDPFSCAERLRFLAPSLRLGVYEGVELDRGSGLPTFKDILTVQIDHEIAGDFLRQHPAFGGIKPSTPKMAAKLAYYERLRAAAIGPLHGLEVRLRRVDRARKTAAFEVVFDRYDPAESVFIRYTLLLEQEDRIWGSVLLERSGDYTRQTSEFRETLERYAQDDSEITFLLLGKLDGVLIEEVTRGRIGPLWSPFCPAPPSWFPGAGSPYVLHMPLDRASVGQDKDYDNDPFSTLFKDFLSETSRPIIQEAADRLGYRVFKDRKFACAPEAAAAFKEKLKAAGTQHVVYVA